MQRKALCSDETSMNLFGLVYCMCKLVCGKKENCTSYLKNIVMAASCCRDTFPQKVHEKWIIGVWMEEITR